MAVIRPTESTLVTSSYVNVPATDRPAPIYTFLAIPTPPSTINAPVDVDVESVVASTLTAPLNVPVLPVKAPVIVAAALTFKFPVVVATLTTKSVLASPTNALPSPLKLAAVTIPVVLVLPAASMVIAVPT